MGIFDLFKKGNTKTTDAKPENPHLPQPKLPVDDRFMKNFIENGGKFIYCENFDEVLESFDNILMENDWYEQDAYCLNSNLEERFKDFNVTYGTSETATFYLGRCEYLIADNGSILFTSNQIKEKKPVELPANMIIYASTSQLVENISDGLRRIKSKSQGRIPSNITTLKHFGQEQSNDFRNYGSTLKNLYLLLLEDL